MMNIARGNLCAVWRRRLLSQPLDPRTIRLRDADSHAERVRASQRVEEDEPTPTDARAASQ